MEQLNSSNHAGAPQSASAGIPAGGLEQDPGADTHVDHTTGERTPEALAVGGTVSMGAPAQQRKKVDWGAMIAELATYRATLTNRVEAAHQYVTLAIPLAGRIQQAMNNAANNFSLAFRAHEVVVKKAATAAADKQGLIDMFIGVGVAVGVGLLAAAALPAAVTTAGIAIAEAGLELAEMGLGNVIGKPFDQHTTEITPSTLDPSVVTTKHGRALIELYKGLAVTGRDATGAGLLLNAITYLRGEAKLHQAGVASEVTPEKMQQALGVIRAASANVAYPSGRIQDLESALEARKAPPDAREMERYIWCHWIGSFGGYDEVSEQTHFHNTDILDNDTIEGYLHGPIKVLGPGSLLGVDFGSYTSEDDERAAVLAADDKWQELYYKMMAYL